MRTSRQEAMWVLRAQFDDREALERLLAAVQPGLRRYLSGLVGEADADDVLQEVLVIVYRRLGELENPELFRPWAFRVASRAGFRHLRRRKRWPDQPGDEVLVERAPAADDRPPDALLWEVLRSEAVSPASRGVLVLHFEEGLSLPDVAAILDVPLGTVKSRLAYGLAALRERLGAKRRSDA
jgi:RNA polymerase sigma-70 factor (ECF subfamily)